MERLERIFRVYFKDIYHFFLQLTQDQDLAEELVSETFFRALKSWSDYRGQASVKSYLIQIGKNAYVDYLRKNQKIIPVDDFYGMDWPSQDDIEASIIEKERNQALVRSIQSLDEIDQAIVSLRFVEGLSFQEIGAIYGKTANWASVRFYRAKNKLRVIMEGN